MDPVSEGNQIFLKIAENWPGDEVPVPGDVDRLFSMLRDLTKGWIIVDFLDAANWDCIAGHDYDSKESLLSLYWHDTRVPDADPKASARPSRLVFPASLYGLFLHLQRIRIVRGKQIAVFLLQGYALTPKEVKDFLTPGAEEFDLEQEHLFSARVIRKVNGLWHVLQAHTAPLYTVALLPKNLGFSATDSRRLLFDVNLSGVLERLRSAHNRLDELADSAVDEISEKANT